MTKKDFELIAGVFKKYKHLKHLEYKITGYALISEVALEMALALASKNDKFQVKKFCEGCGIE